ncbi:GAF domain-containing protein [Entomobacter blattae]|uniref:Free methionine-R-sulfoxide reductase n=1 Tax=Entomobacter blattae TaxID=2762277 RepID=A0A7H1NNL2_9PROT|nr:GAF domain-containing protein [Entomobacter blattae]QNT77372.1 Free methionine-R-sulfoxide reductase [Entomobacter blattae]
MLKPRTASFSVSYEDDILPTLEALLAEETDFIANAANTAALLFEYLPNINWVGFYLMKDNQLVLGPFQGKAACVRIPLGKGVCGTAAQKKETVIVDDVNHFEGHIACDSASQSEIVIPLIKNNTVIGVLDIDSPLIKRFSEQDKNGLEKAAQIFLHSFQTLS